MKNYSERLGELYANFQQIQSELCNDALQLVTKPTSYRGIKEAEQANLQKSTSALADLVNASSDCPASRLVSLHMLYNAEYTVYPLSHLTLTAANELNMLYQLMVDVESSLERQIA